MTDSLQTRPTATTFDLEKLLGEAWAGRLRIPHFQREFRWDRQDVIRLFDSIVRGYPVGSLLLWSRPAASQLLKLGQLEIEAPATNEALWVVDGQQRLTSLANVLHPDGANDPRFRIAYDLRAREFSLRPHSQDPWVVPLPVIFDLQRLLRWFAEHPELTEHLDEATSLARKIRQFSVPAYLVKHDEVAVLQDIFDRMNNYGKRLRRAEVFSALYAGDENSHESNLTIDGIANAISGGLGFGLLDSNTVLQGVLARRGPDVARDLRVEFSNHERRGVFDFRGEDRDTAFAAGARALERAVVFLREEVGVPHVSLLAYRYLLVVMTRFFAHHPEPSRRSRVLLARWYWREAVRGPLTGRGSVMSTVRALCAKVRSDDEAASVSALVDAADTPPGGLRAPTLTRFRTNSAETKILLSAWWSIGPRSPITGQRYGHSQLSSFLGDSPTAASASPQVVPRRSLKEEHQDWAANRVLLPDEAVPVNELDSCLAVRPREVTPDTWRLVLRSHGLTNETERLLLEERWDDFIESRTEVLQDDAARFVAERCAWDSEAPED
ncbi:hypothetical protein C1701_04105 [Actinoalloteichus sp. AHMU CJ021]|uniref:DUF262 domain-containing protein n=1 Tax=Actinoalloteichus sp. AHMU CJ021 TaxID=2072503 RepID=UPI000CA0891C|nr:hypothetical protein C1701_04105 [Actinoalloteichus sp. AHMU CJ021]